MLRHTHNNVRSFPDLLEPCKKKAYLVVMLYLPKEDVVN